MKECITCSIEKPDDDYPWHSAGKRAGECRQCRAIYLAAYREASKSPEARAAFLADVARKKADTAELARARKKAFRAEYEKRPHVVEYRTAYKAKPERKTKTKQLRKRPEKLSARAARHRHLRQSDQKFLLHGRMTCRMRGALRGAKQGRSWLSLVDYTVDELRAHIERQFTGGMGWHNAGEWHIDHIIPVASFSFAAPGDAGFRRCWALANLRPLWREDNIRKSDKILTLL